MSNINKLSLINEGPAASRTYELSLNSCLGNYTIEWDFNPNNELSVAIPCRITIDDEVNTPISTGFSGDSSYDQELGSLGFSATSSNNSSGTLVYNRNNPEINKVKLLIESPIPGSKWRFTLRCPTICDSDSDLVGYCGIPIYVYGPKTISCGAELLLGGNRNLIGCDDITIVHGPEGDSDYCLNCLSNEVSVLIQCNPNEDDSDSDSDSDSDVNTRVLFDKSSWNNIPAPYKEYLDEAADRWNDLVKINENVFNAAVTYAAQAGESNWVGVRLADQNIVDALGDNDRPFNFEITNDVAYVASCGPVTIFDTSNVTNNGYNGSVSKPHISINFTLKVSSNYSAQGADPISREKWISVLTHELGHALGFGIFWVVYGNNPKSILGEDPPSNNYLDGTLFKNAQAAYNQIVGDQTLTKIPLENDPQLLSQDTHWENQVRFGDSVYPGLLDEVMVSTIKQDYLTISRLTIGALKDIGYEEVTPGNHEGAPNTISQ